MPISAILLSLLGLAPFIGCGLGALGNHPGTAAHMVGALLTWGAVVLSFAAGVHWGLVLREADASAPSPEASRMRHLRVGMAVLPLLAAWGAVVLPLVTFDWVGLVVLIAAYIAMLAVEHRFSSEAALPSRYLMLRWVFTIVAVAMLTTVLTLRLLGQTIVL